MKKSGIRETCGSKRHVASMSATMASAPDARPRQFEVERDHDAQTLAMPLQSDERHLWPDR